MHSITRMICSEAPPLFEVKAPENAPNVVIVLIDDIGFGGPSTFGGPIQTPTLDRLAAAGLSYNNFHTTALCSPTRNALKTGRNHHTPTPGQSWNPRRGSPGTPGRFRTALHRWPRCSVSTVTAPGHLANGTKLLPGKPAFRGPFDRWPTHQGFDKFYGFHRRRDGSVVPADLRRCHQGHSAAREENYHFTVDMTDQAVNWVKAQQSMTPDRPFFMYYATGAVHAPHHVPKEWADKYKGQVRQGWDEVRAETIARQKKMGVIPAGHRIGTEARGHQGLGCAVR